MTRDTLRQHADTALREGAGLLAFLLFATFAHLALVWISGVSPDPLYLAGLAFGAAWGWAARAYLGPMP